ncbi:hypothetical protein DFH09DRAFT_1366575 [Mycena vulgaris]|nr:hypothetical protein DFH09DRAFT_1366575 [Mycena vulgaris]
MSSSSLTAPTLSIAQHVQTLLTGLRSPITHETGCLFSMFRACRMMDRANAHPSSELTRAAMHFLLSIRTPASADALTAQLLSCSCQIFDLGKTPPATLQPLECLDLFIHHLCTMIREALRDLRPAKFRTRKPNQTARRAPWPNCLADIGLDSASCADVVDTLLRWTSPAPIGSEILALLGALARFWNPLGEHLMRSPNIVCHVRRTLVEATRFYEYPIPPQSVGFFPRAVEACYSLERGLHQVNAEYSMQNQCWSDALLDLAPGLVPLLARHAPRLDAEREWLSTMLLRRGLTVPGALVKPSAHGSAVNDDYFQARYEMMVSARRRKCMNLQCRVPPYMAVTTTLCAQCGVVTYCSTACQKSAWKAERCPHKDVCTLIARIRGCLDLARPERSTSATDKEYKAAVRAVDESWRKWLMRTPAPQAGAILHDKGVTPRSCRAIWLYFLMFNRAKGLSPLHFRLPRGQWQLQRVDPKDRFGTGYIEDFEG